MKVVQTKPATTSAAAKTNTPFFNKEAGHNFFSPGLKNNDAFFKPKNTNHPIQAKLNIGKPNDHYEHEADSVADKVVQRLSGRSSNQNKQKSIVNTISPLVQTKCSECGKENIVEEKESSPSKLQKKNIPESNQATPEDGIHRKCMECEKKEKLQEKEKVGGLSTLNSNLQKKAIFESNEESPRAIQKKPDSSPLPGASPKVESSLNASKGSGSALPQQTRQQMESSFGADFTAVRVHDSSSAAQMNKELQAQAFTHGSDIYFNSGKYDTSSKSGQHLLAHELTHVVQQKTDLIQKKVVTSKSIETNGATNQLKNSRTESINKTTANKSHLAETQNKLQNNDKEEEELNGKKLQKRPIFNSAAETPPDDTVQNNITKVANSIQKAGDDVAPNIPDKIKQGTPLANGDHMEANGDVIEIHIGKFLLKNHVAKLPETPIEKPKKGEDRNTNQSNKWRTETSPDVKTALSNIYKEKTVNESISINLKKTVDKLKKTPNAPTAQIIGSSKDLSREVAVPFWNLKGDNAIHQVEHAVDVQILGNVKADVLANFVLIDEESNANLKDDVMSTLSNRVRNILKHYKIDKDVTVNKALSEYKIWFDSFEKDSIVKTKSIIYPSDFKKAKEGNPINSDLIVVQAAEVPAGHLVLKTSKGSTGYILPYNFSSTHLELKGNASTHTLESVIFKKFLDDPKKQMTVLKPFPLNFEGIKDQQDYFKIDAALMGANDIIQKDLKFNFLSPIQLDDNLELNPHTGASVTGKIKTKVKPLENIDIDFYVRDGIFGITASATFDKIKIPNPFRVRYTTLALEANSNKDFTGSGEIGFGIDKFGEGRVNVAAGTNGLAFNGEFILDKKLFDGKITVGFTKQKNDEEGSWSFTGTVIIGKKKIPGLEKLTLTFSKEKDAMGDKGDAITAKGNAILSIPGIHEVAITAVIAANGDWSIQGDIDLNKIPKLKGASGKIFVQKGKDGWDVAMEGKVKPDVDIQGLKVNEIDVSYKKGVFDISTLVNYERGRVKGDFTLGATNNPVTEDGKKQEGDGGKQMKFYADGVINVLIADGVGGTIHVKVKPEGDILLDGKIELTEDKPLFTPQSLERTIFELDENIPLASCVVVTLSLHLGGSIKIYAHLKPLIFDKGSYVGLSNVSLKNFSNAKITSEINISSHLDAGVQLGLAIGLDASLLGILHAGVDGTGDLDFRALDADAHAHFAASWSAEKGLQLDNGHIDIELMSKIIATVGARARVYANLLVTKVTLWSHKWDLGHKEWGIHLFGDGKITIPLPIGKDGGISLNPADMENNMTKIKASANPKNIAEKSKDLLDHDGQTEEDKQAEASSVIKKEILDNFRDSARLQFNKSVDYLTTRYQLVNYLRDQMRYEKIIDLSYVEEEIKKAEFEEYEAYGPYITSETFDADTKYMLIDEFIKNHPTLGETEKVNLRSNVVKKKNNNLKPIQKKEKKPQNEILQTNPESPDQTTGSPKFENNLNASKGTGFHLPNQTLKQMESSFGSDFSKVKIHNDQPASKMTENLHAKAFAHGYDIYFGTENYNTESKEGKHLLAHELTHVVQNEGASIKKTPSDTAQQLNSPSPITASQMPPDYEAMPYNQLLDIYASYNVSYVDRDENDSFEAVQHELIKRIKVALEKFRTGKCKPGTDLSIGELYGLKEIVDSLANAPELKDQLLLDISFLEIQSYPVQIEATLFQKQKEAFKPALLTSTPDFTALNFIDVFNSLQEADFWLTQYATKNEKQEGRPYIQELRIQLKTKVTSGLPFELFDQLLEPTTHFVTSIDADHTLEYIYAMENILYTAGYLKAFAEQNKSVKLAFDPWTFLVPRQEIYKVNMSNNLRILKVHLNSLNHIADYTAISEGGLTHLPSKGKDLATDPVGIRFQLTKIWSETNYYGYGEDYAIYHLLHEIEVGDYPPGTDPKWLTEQIKFQWEQLKKENEDLLNNFSSEVIRDTNEILDASERKLRLEAKKLGINIDENLIGSNFAGITAAQNLNDNNQQLNKFETKGITESASRLAKVKREIEDLDINLSILNHDVIDKLSDWGLSKFADISSGQIKAEIQTYLSHKQDLISQKSKQREQTQMEYNLLREQLELKYPMLASWASRGDSDDLNDLAEGGSQTDFKLINDIYSKLSNIKKVKSELGDDISIWELLEIIPIAKNKMSILPFSFEDTVIETKIKREREDKEFWETFKIVVALGLTVVSLGSLSEVSAGIVLAARVGTVALDAYDAYKSYKDYDIKSAMSNTDFDLALSLSHEEPSLLSLAMSVIALVFDIHDAKDIFNSSSKLLKKTLSKSKFLEEAEEIAAKGIKDEASRAKYIEMMETRREVAKTTEEVEDVVSKALEDESKFNKIGPESDKTIVTKTGIIYKCASPCEQLRSKFAQQILNNDKLAQKLDSIEQRLAAVGGNIIQNPSLKAEIDELEKVFEANKILKANASEIINPADPRFRQDPPIGESFLYRDGDGTIGKVHRVDHDTLEISTEFGQKTVRSDYNAYNLSAGQVGLPTGKRGFERLHSLGPIVGHESPFGILYGPYWVNHFLQLDGIEEILKSVERGDEEILSVVVKRKTLPVPDKIVGNGDFLDSITYKIGTTDVTLKVLDPSNPVSDVLIEVVTESGAYKELRQASDYI